MLLNMIAKPAPSGSVKNPLNSSAASVCHTTFPVPTSIAAMFVFTPDAHGEVVTSRYFRVHLDPNGPNCRAVMDRLYPKVPLPLTLTLSPQAETEFPLTLTLTLSPDV